MQKMISKPSYVRKKQNPQPFEHVRIHNKGLKGNSQARGEPLRVELPAAPDCSRRRPYIPTTVPRITYQISPLAPLGRNDSRNRSVEMTGCRTIRRLGRNRQSRLSKARGMTVGRIVQKMFRFAQHDRVGTSNNM